MAVLLWGSAASVLGFFLHVLLWRVRVPKRQTRALLLIFCAVLALVLAGLHAVGPSAGVLSFPLPVNAEQFVHIALFAFAMALAYTITYSALEADSPSIALVLVIAAAEPQGLEEAEFERRMSDDLLVKPRLEDLVRDGLAVWEEGRYRMTSKGRRFVAIFIFYRGLLGAPKGG